MIPESLWTELEGERPVGPGLVRRRVKEQGERNLFIAVSHPRLERVLILLVPANAAALLGDPPSTKALTTTAVVVADDVIEIRVVLTAPEMANVFSAFVDDVTDHLAAAETDNDAVRALTLRFGHWKRLLSGAALEGLGPNESQALWGELWVMRNLLHPRIGSAAVTGWTGPERADRDFLFGDVAVEVKTTRGDRPAVATITSERQLDSSALGTLLLVALGVEVIPGGLGETLNEMVDQLRSIVGPSMRAELDDRLHAYGYADVHREKYSVTRYALREMRLYAVEEGFPRITEASLPPGVGRVTYQLALDACDPWRIDDKQFSSAVGVPIEGA